jgi:hypothetical protein
MVSLTLLRLTAAFVLGRATIVVKIRLSAFSAKCYVYPEHRGVWKGGIYIIVPV